MRDFFRRLPIACLVALISALLVETTWAGSPPPPPPPAVAPTFQDQINAVCATDFDCFPGSAGTASGAGGTPGVSAGLSPAERSAIQRRLRQLECPDGDCPEVSSVAAETLGSGLGLFASFDYERKDRDETRFEAGFDSDRYTGTVGVDYQVSPIAVIGIALSYGRSNGDFDNDGGDFDRDSYGGHLYASVFPIENAFVDIILGYTWSNYDYTRTVTVQEPGDPGPQILGSADGDPDEHEYTAAVTGGYDFYYGPVTVGPRLGLAFRRTTLESYSESGITSVNLEYDDQDETSFTTSLGAQASYAASTGFGVLVPQVNADWVHEFANDAEEVEAHFVDPPFPQIEYKTDRGDRDYFNLGASLTAVLQNGLSPFASYSAQVGNSLETIHAIAIGLRVEL